MLEIHDPVTTDRWTEEELARFRIAAARRMLYREGCDSWVGGHVSMRSEDPRGAFWVTPLQYFDETLPSDVMKVTFDMQILGQDQAASPALAFHASIYQARPDVQSVIHTHSDAVAMLATLREPLGMYNLLASVFYEDVVLQDLEGPSDESFGDAFATDLGDAKVLLMLNHGCIVVSDSVQHAAAETMMFEKAAHFHVGAKMIGGQELPLAETLRVRSGLLRIFRDQMWAANVRRLHRSDPELFVGIDPELVAAERTVGGVSGILTGPEQQRRVGT